MTIPCNDPSMRQIIKLTARRLLLPWSAVLAVAALGLSACTSSTPASAKVTASTVQSQVGHILSKIYKLQPGVVGVTCAGSTCHDFGSSSAPLASGLGRAVSQLERVNFPAHDQNAAVALLSQLRLMESDFQQLGSVSPSSPEAATVGKSTAEEVAALKLAIANLRKTLHLPAEPDGWLS
jgi:hypothetical protein